jgi:hypothetical protein
VTYTLEHERPRYSTVGLLPNIDDYPVLNATATTTFNANFLNDCGIDGVCVSDLVVFPVLQLPKGMFKILGFIFRITSMVWYYYH